jgi:hypothetical protein
MILPLQLTSLTLFGVASTAMVPNSAVILLKFKLDFIGLTNSTELVQSVTSDISYFLLPYAINNRNRFYSTQSHHDLVPRQPRFLGTLDKATWLHQMQSHWGAEAT